MGHKITKKEAVQMGLLTPEEQPSPSGTRMAESTTEWINPKTVSDSIQLVMRRIL